MTHSLLSKAVEQFAAFTHSIPDSRLERAWAWQSYDSEGLRFAFFRTYEELRELTVKLRSERFRLGQPITAAQLCLAPYVAAYWDLQAALLGLENSQLEQVPAEGEWPVQKVLAHIVGAELWFYVVVRYGLDRLRSQDGRPAKPTPEAWGAATGLDEAEFHALMAGPVADRRAYYAKLHARVLQEFAEISEAELEAPSTYWESEPMSVRFRLHRFDSHLRQHTVQIDKALAMIEPAPREAKRLLRLIYGAMADVESALMGAEATGEASQFGLAQTISARGEELAGLAA